METVRIWMYAPKITPFCYVHLVGTQQAVQQMGQVIVNVGNTTIESVNSYQYLGVKLESHLKFDEHVLYIKQKTFSKIT